jgi:hypothetical protein
MSQFPIQPRTQRNDLRAATPDGDERAKRAVNQRRIASPKATRIFELNATHIVLGEWIRLPENCRCQSFASATLDSMIFDSTIFDSMIAAKTLTLSRCF